MESNTKMSETSTNIIIVGGGIAGLASVSQPPVPCRDSCSPPQAIALRSPTRHITVLERSRMLRETGALISLQPNASKIVSQWGLDPFLAPYGPMEDKAFRMLDQTGSVIREIKLDNSRFGAGRMLYHRQDLHSALKEAATSTALPGRPAAIRASAAVTACDPDAGTVTLEGGEVLAADIIIGADGIHSVIRDAVVPNTTGPIPTGLSAYRMLMPIDSLRDINLPSHVFNPADPLTTMIVGHDRRIIMGPARDGTVLGIVALVPDKEMHEATVGTSWVAEGSLSALLEAYAGFPEWIHALFSKAPDIALWQLRDIDALPRWVRGRAILVGDAAHAMLPTQGQGASQSFEDAEALQAFLGDLGAKPTGEQVNGALMRVFEARHERAGVIQKYSREQARPATDGVTNEIKLDPGQFLEYNCRYQGAKEWVARGDAVKV